MSVGLIDEIVLSAVADATGENTGRFVPRSARSAVALFVLLAAWLLCATTLIVGLVGIVAGAYGGSWAALMIGVAVFAGGLGLAWMLGRWFRPSRSRASRR